MPRCKECKEKFEPKYFNQKFCMNYDECIKAHSTWANEKEWKKKKKEIKESLKTHSDYVKELQVVFNRYIRLRDKDKPCISCKTILKGKYDAGHFLSVGNYPGLRFNEKNVHGQCVHCNQWRGGNLHEYRDNLEVRIGEEELRKLELSRDTSNKLTIPELIELKELYKEKIRKI